MATPRINSFCKLFFSYIGEMFDRQESFKSRLSTIIYLLFPSGIALTISFISNVSILSKSITWVFAVLFIPAGFSWFLYKKYELKDDDFLRTKNELQEIQNNILGLKLEIQIPQQDQFGYFVFLGKIFHNHPTKKANNVEIFVSKIELMNQDGTSRTLFEYDSRVSRSNLSVPPIPKTCELFYISMGIQRSIGLAPFGVSATGQLFSENNFEIRIPSPLTTASDDIRVTIYATADDALPFPHTTQMIRVPAWLQEEGPRETPRLT